MLDIPEMAEEDKLFYFQTGLQQWAQLEVRRQGAKDLASAIATADSLVDFQSSAALDGEKAKSRPKEKKFEKKPMKAPSRLSSGGKVKEDRPRTEGRPAGGQNSKSSGCFICDGPHRAWDCPKREKLTALVTKGDSTLTLSLESTLSSYWEHCGL